MSSRLHIFLTLCSAAGGIAAGWLTAADGEPGKARSGRIAPAVSKDHASPPAAPGSVEIPDLTTVAECRDFLRLAESRYKGRHPLLLRSLRDYAIRRWLELDAESTLSEAERQPGGQFARDLFRVWLDLNVASAITAWHQASPALTRAARYSFLTALAEKDGRAAVAECKASRDATHEHWDEAENEIYRIWSKYDLPAAAQTAHTSRPAGNNQWFNLGTADPAKTLEDPNREMSEEGKRGLLNKWTELDPTGVLRWAESQPPGSPMLLAAERAVVRKIAYSDPERAIGILQHLQEEAPPNDANLSTWRAHEVSETWREILASEAAADIAHARELVMSQPPEVRRDALRGYFTYAFSADPAAAVAQCREWIADPAAKDMVLAAFANSFSWWHGSGTRDPSLVLAAIPEFADRIDAGILSGWAKTNPRGAADWLAERTFSGHPVSNLQDKGVIADIAISEPVWTAQWVTTLTDPGLQNEAAETLTANWAAFDPDAAREWMESLPEGPLRTAAENGFIRRNGK